MKKVIILTLALFIAMSGAEAFAIQKVSKKSKKDSTKIEKKIDKKTPAVKLKSKAAALPVKDKFIDKDGDGINDDYQKRKAPAVKKVAPPKPKPKIEQKMPVKVKKIEKKNSEKDTSSKKSKR
ncbi:MAG: hypothetical protein J7K40_11695 [candidate division Zixibacteria bacterium]|nr:hypothetical protein [candidate division Zixibacteria bacterium]